jgi:ABC-type multidrug transport system permease subunit
MEGTMNWKRLWLAALIVFVVLQVTNIIIHSGILAGVYQSPDVKEAFRDPVIMGKYMWVLWVTAIVYAFFFAFIFAKGYEGKGVMEGVRYGIYIGIFAYFVSSFNQFVLYRIPYVLTWYWILLGLIQSIILGIVAALIYKSKQVAVPA